MRFTIELPDELFRPAPTAGAPPATVSTPNVGDALSGGAGPGAAGGVSAGGVSGDLGPTAEALSAGPAEQPSTPVEPGAATQETHDGGPAPTSVR